MNKSHSKIKLEFDRLLSKSLWSQFAILGIAFIIALGLSYLMLSWSGAEWREFCGRKGLKPALLPIYLLIDSNALNNIYFDCKGSDCVAHEWMLIGSTISFLIGAFLFNGMIIGFITNSIGQRVTRHNTGHVHYLKSGHYIIMGYDDMIPSIINSIFEKDKDAFVLLLSAADSVRIREKLRKVFTEAQLSKIIINFGHRTSKDYYKDIHLETAEQVFIVGLRTLPSHDAINVECVDSICSYLEQPQIKGRPKRITCVFEDLDTYAAFKTSEIFGRVSQLNIEFVPYNFYTGWAKQVFVKQFHKDTDHPGEQIKYPSVYGKGYAEDDKTALTKDDPRYVHLVFVGTTNFAVAFAMEATHVLHFPNGSNVKTQITFIDLNADKEKDEFIVRNRHYFEIQPYYYCDLSGDGKYEPKEKRVVRECVYFTEEHGYTANDASFLDVEFEFIKGDVFSKKVQDIICQWAKEHNEKQYLSVFLAMAEQHQNFVMGMNMPDAIYYKEVPVFICQNHSDNFVSNLRKTDDAIRMDEKRNTYTIVKDGKLQKKVQGGRYANIYPFGMNETAYCADEKSLELAKLINYLYCTMHGSMFQSLLALDAKSDEQIWAEANESWRGLTVALKWSNLYNAYSLQTKLASLRSIRGLKQDDTSHDTKTLNDDEVEYLAQIEHNRWNIEKLMMGYRKPHRDEDKYAVEDEEMKKSLKENKERFIHHDIRPYEDLDGVQELDKEFSRYLPWIIKMANSKRG